MKISLVCKAIIKEVSIGKWLTFLTFCLLISMMLLYNGASTTQVDAAPFVPHQASLPSIDQTAPALAIPSTIVVDNINDIDDGNHASGELTLREALALAQTGDTVTFAASLMGETIVLSSTLDVVTDITIHGGGIITISGNNQVGVFAITSGANVTIVDMTIINGNNSSIGGGAINIASTSALTISHSTIEGNNSADGGGLLNYGTLTIYRSTIAENTAQSGGGIANNGILSVYDSTFFGNEASGDFNGAGGGIFNTNVATATIKNSTLSNNTANDSYEEDGSGGGIYNDGAVYIYNSTLSNNSADPNQAGGLDSLGNAWLKNTIIANNTGTDCFMEVAFAHIHNLIGDGSCNIDNPIGMVTGDPLLGPLQNNGGDTDTHAITPDSPAWNAGDNTTCLPTDQRGVLRPQDQVCDIGAFEYKLNQPPVAVTDVYSVTDNSLDNSLPILDNDSDPENDALTIIALGTPTISNSQVSIANARGTITQSSVYYTPAPNFSGTDSFTYTISDGALTASAMVTINVTLLPDSVPVISEEIEPIDDPEFMPIPVNESNNNQQVTVTPGEVVEIKVNAYPSTGSLWNVNNNTTSRKNTDGPVFREGRTVYNSDQFGQDTVGQPVSETIRLYPLQAGETTVELALEQPTPNGLRQTGQTIVVQLNAEGSFDDIPLPSDPPEDTTIPPLFGLGEQTSSGQRNSAASSLPTKFNWCDQGGCTPIKSQSPCGNCWSFTINSVVESKIKLAGGGEKDLSEQYITSCNTTGYTCNSGGWWTALNHYKDIPTTQAGPGVIYETEVPYQGTDITCPAGLSPHETIVDWKYADQPALIAKQVPAVNDIKQAIHDHGPVAAAVCVGSAFQAYSGGIFTTDEKAACGGSINHAIVLTGWDDVAGVWHMRNSWGTWWGESGNMRIKYGVSNIGYGAAYVIYQGATNNTPDIPTNLTSNVSGNNVTLNWTDKSSDETGFEVWRLTNGTWAKLNTLAANTQTYQDTSGTCNTPYQYKVRAINANGQSAFSNLAKETTAGCANLLTPTNLTATSLNNQIRLNWSDPNPDSDGVEVWRWNADTKQWEKLATVAKGQNSYVDTQSLKHGVSYYYQIRAIKGTSLSNATNQISGKMADIHINAPTNLQATLGLTSEIVLNWTTNSSIAQTTVIQRYNDQTASWDDIGTVPANTTTYTDTNLDCQAYSYQVAAQIDSLKSSYSNLAKETVVACNDKVYLPLLLK